MAVYHGSSPGSNLKIGPLGCQEAGWFTGMTINDPVAGRCWSVMGIRIVIGPSTDSMQHAMEAINYNFSQDVTQRAVPTNLALNNTLGVTA